LFLKISLFILLKKNTFGQEFIHLLMIKEYLFLPNP